MPAGTVADEPEGPSVTGLATDGPADDLATVQPMADMPAGTVVNAASPTIADATVLPVSKIPMSKIVTAPMPPMLFQRSLATPSLVAHIASDKWCDGLPLHRQEDRFKRLGLPIDRGTMSRWLEHAGATVGATVVHAMHADAMLHAFCILTDATGVLVQPIRDEPKGDKPRRSLQRQSCRRGHFFVQIADGEGISVVDSLLSGNQIEEIAKSVGLTGIAIDYPASLYLARNFSAEFPIGSAYSGAYIASRAKGTWSSVVPPAATPYTIRGSTQIDWNGQRETATCTAQQLLGELSLKLRASASESSQLAGLVKNGGVWNSLPLP
jgi:hypothetical protein